ncbi:MAG: trypsin-like peptidase domain-containing protein [Planctomycetes bacterium]|nr:trypsin-like peptidase domain-containing protein [Planctomycetota bacterium]
MSSEISLRLRVFAYLFFVSVAHFYPATCDGVTVPELSKTVVWVRFEHQIKPPDPNSLRPATKKTSSGTGFLIRHTGISYIVTAKHILSAPPNSGFFAFKSVSGKLWKTKFSEVQQKMPGAHWFLHKSRDIAIHPYGYPPGIEAAVLSVPDELLDSNPQPLLSPVCCIGFPMNLGIAKDLFTPVAKHAYIANPSISIRKFDLDPTKRLFILLDEAMAQGFSGAPVFSLYSDSNANTRSGYSDLKPRLLGIVAGTKFDLTGGKFGYVVPVAHIMEIFEYPEFLQYERAILKKVSQEKESADL